MSKFLPITALLVLLAGCSSKQAREQTTEAEESPESLVGLVEPLFPTASSSELSTTECETKGAIIFDNKTPLQEFIQGSPAGATIKIPPGDYPALVIQQPVHLIGVTADGSCADLGGKNQGPNFGRIHVTKEGANTTLQGFDIREGGLLIEGQTTILDTSATGADICIEAKATMEADRFIAHSCSVGVSLQAPSTMANGIIAENTEHGLIAAAPSTLHHLTVARNGKNGIHLEASGSRVFNSILAENKQWGLFEEKRALLLEHVSFSKNALGNYGGADENLLDPPIEWEDKRFIAITLTQGDRKGTEPALATQAIIRAEMAKRAPWSLAESDASRIEKYRPSKRIQSARKGYIDPKYDVGKKERSLNPRVGAVEWEAKNAPAPNRQWYVTTRGKSEQDGTLNSPLGSIQEAVDRARPGDVINVLPGRYRESVLIQETHLTVRGVRIDGNALVPIRSPEETPRPIIDPSETGTHEQAVFLQDTLYGMTLSGLTIENALTGLTVIGRIDDVPPEPLVEGILFRDNQKAFDADCGGGLLRNNHFKNNDVAATFRAGNHWVVEGNEFHGPGAGVVFSMLITHGLDGFTLDNNLFHGAGIYVDSLHGRHGASLQITNNVIQATELAIRHGSPTALLELENNQFTDGAHLTLHEPEGDRPPCKGCLQISQCQGFCSPGQTREAGKPLVDNGPVQPHSTPIAISKNGEYVVAVGADFQGISIYRPQERLKPTYVTTGLDPRTVAIGSDSTVALVANLGDGTISLVNINEGRLIKSIPVGIEPYGVIFSPNEEEAWVTLSGESAVAVVNLAEGSVIQKIPVEHKPRGISLDYRNGNWRALVTHFTPQHDPNEKPGTTGGINALLSILTPGDTNWSVKPLVLPPVVSEHFPPSVPVLMQSVVVRGDRAFLPSFGATPERPSDVVMEGRRLLPFETTIQALLTVIDLEKDVVIESETTNLNAPGRILNGPYGIAFTSDSSPEVLMPIYGNNAIARFDLYEGEEPRPHRAYRGSVDIFVGTNPRGVAIHPTMKEAYTVNFASGDLAVVDLERSQTIRLYPLGPTEKDRLSRTARQGKELFYTTQRVDTAADFWFSCGTCHPDGRTDGVTWEFSNGPRSTPVLAASLDSLPLHFDGDRDEFSDFEHTVRDLQGGFSLDRKKLLPSLGAPSSKPLAHGWRAMEAYLREGIDAPRATTLSPEKEEEGRKVFVSLGCDKCHGGEWFAPDSIDASRKVSNGQVIDTLENVNTKTDRDLLGDGAFDPPSLWGLSQTAPYLHDGSAFSLSQVLENKTHLLAGLGPQKTEREVSTKEKEALLLYLASITEGTDPP